MPAFTDWVTIKRRSGNESTPHTRQREYRSSGVRLSKIAQLAVGTAFLDWAWGEAGNLGEFLLQGGSGIGSFGLAR